MFRIKTRHLFLLPGLLVPFYASAANYCIATGGGFGSGGTTFIGIGFTLPAANNCAPWAGYTKTATTVILTTTGTGCMSSNNKVLTLSVFSTDPAYLGTGTIAVDYIRVCPTASCPIGSGTDQGQFGGSAAPETCTTKLVTLPMNHD
jgi:hypothetical protein